MKLKRLRRLIPFILTVVLVSLVGLGASGQSIQAVDDEDIRTKLTELNNDLIKLYQYIEAEAPSNLLEQLYQNQKLISELTDEQLDQAEEIFSLHPIIFDASKVLLSIYERIETERGLMSTAMASCPPGPTLGEVYFAKEVAHGADTAARIIPLGVTVVVAGFGATLPNPIRIIADGFWSGYTFDALDLEERYLARDACLQGNHRDLLEDHDTLLREHDQRMQDIVGNIHFILDNKVELRRVHLQVIELREKQVFLVHATEAGIPIADVSLISMRASERNPVSFMDVEVTSWEMLADDIGTYILEINLPKELKNANLFKFEVQHAPDPEIAHFGFVIFDRSTQNTITTGQ